MGKKHISCDEFQNDLNEVIEYLNEKIIEMSKKKQSGVRGLQHSRMLLEELSKKVKYVSNRKQREPRDPSLPPPKTGLNINVNVSPELREFLKVDENEEITRTDITIAICAYIHIKDDETRERTLSWKKLNEENRDLRYPEDKRQIILDETLKKLFKIGDDIDRITFFQMQTYIQQHIL